MTLKRKKISFIIAGAITFVVIAVILVLLNVQAFKPQIESVASNALGMDVRIKGRLGITLFPGLGISMKGVSVQNREVDVVTIEETRIGMKLIPLMRREIRISRLGLIRPAFSIVRYKNGMFNFEKPGRALLRRFPAVKKIFVSEGRLVYADEGSGKRIDVEGFDVTIRNLSYSGTDGAELFKNISFGGNAKSKTLTINKFTLTNLAMRAAGGNGILDVNLISMDIFGGTGNGSIHVDVRGASPHYRVITTLNRCRSDELIQAFSPGESHRKSIDGTVKFSVDLTATGMSADEVKRSLSGDLSLNGENLILDGLDIDALIPKYERSQNFNLVDVGSYFLAGPFGPVLTKSYNLASLYQESKGGKGIIRKLVSNWKIQNGIAGATDVALASKKYRIAMKGGLNFIDDRFVDVTVAVLDKRGCAVYSQKVRGPFRQPKIEKVSIFKSIAGPVLNALEDAWKLIQGGECTVFYSGSVVQPEG